MVASNATKAELTEAMDTMIEEVSGLLNVLNNLYKKGKKPLRPAVGWGRHNTKHAWSQPQCAW